MRWWPVVAQGGDLAGQSTAAGRHGPIDGRYASQECIAHAYEMP